MIEMVVVIVIIGILAGAAIPIIGTIDDNAKYSETVLEMTALAESIRGSRNSYSNGHRSDFGYLGDIGAFPAVLDDLIRNPGGYTSWNGPYISNRLNEVGGDFKTDAWGSEYIYSRGTAILSIGSGDTIVCNIASSRDKILYNRISGNLYDIDGTPPQRGYQDSLQVRLYIPDGSGGYAWRTAGIFSGGYFEIDSIPIGQHNLEAIFLNERDTLELTATVLPGGENNISLKGDVNIWYDETTIVPEGLVGYWRFNQSSGTEALDESGFANNAQLINMNPAGDWVSGKIGNALVFDGNDDYLDCGNDTELELTRLSAACWVRTSVSGTYRQILCKNRRSGDDSYYFCLNDLRPAVYLGGTANEGWHETSSAVPTGVWTHIAFTYDGSKVILYINGYPDRVISPVTGDVNLNSGSDLWIGTRSDLSGREFEGSLDDVRLYNRALSGSEVARLAGL